MNGPTENRKEATPMFVCLCTGATSHEVADAIAGGACTSRQVALACGAGTDCGRCLRTVRAILAAEADRGADQNVADERIEAAVAS